MATRALDLFQAYSQNKLPQEGGYIVSSFLDKSSTYSKYEIVAYNGVKSIHLTAEGMTFQTDGNKIFVLVEPPSYAKKFIEPFRRQAKDQIPHRFSELEIITDRKQNKIMISKEPILTYSSFTVLKPHGGDFAFIFYNLDDVNDTMKLFFEKTLNKEAQVPQADAAKAADYIIQKINNFSIWRSDE